MAVTDHPPPRAAHARDGLAVSLKVMYPAMNSRECEVLANAIVDEAVLNGYMSPLRAVRQLIASFLAKHGGTR